MPRLRARVLTLLYLGIFVAGTLMASRPRDLPRPLGRDKSHAFTDYRPKGRSRLDTIASEEVDRFRFIQVAANPGPPAGRARLTPDLGRTTDLPNIGRSSTRSILFAAPRLTLHLRC